MPARRKDQKKPRKTDSSRHVLPAELDHLREGFAGRAEAKVPFRRLHFHDHIEVSVNEQHPVVAMFGAQRITLPPNHLVVFWAAQPHGPIETTPGGWAYGIHLPLPWVLQWRLPPVLMRRLLAGEILIDPPSDRPVADLELLKNWVRLLEDDSKELRSVVLLEAEGRLRRLAVDLARRKPSSSDAKPLPIGAYIANEPIRGERTSKSGRNGNICDGTLKIDRVGINNARGSLGRFERMATLVATHYREPLTINDIAEAVRMAPASAMRVFRKFSGMTLHEFLMHHRVSHAQRLLATTDGTIDHIAAESGFGSPARFYACFGKLVGQSPSAYRRSFAENG
jgi:AraC family transcriptional regulator, melibiose operon regulatory protein